MIGSQHVDETRSTPFIPVLSTVHFHKGNIWVVFTLGAFVAVKITVTVRRAPTALVWLLTHLIPSDPNACSSYISANKHVEHNSSYVPLPSYMCFWEVNDAILCYEKVTLLSEQVYT